MNRLNIISLSEKYIESSDIDEKKELKRRIENQILLDFPKIHEHDKDVIFMQLQGHYDAYQLEKIRIFSKTILLNIKSLYKI